MTFLGIRWGAACYPDALGGMFLVPLTVEEAGVGGNLGGTRNRKAVYAFEFAIPI